MERRGTKLKEMLGGKEGVGWEGGEEIITLMAPSKTSTASFTCSCAI